MKRRSRKLLTMRLSSTERTALFAVLLILGTLLLHVLAADAAAEGVKTVAVCTDGPGKLYGNLATETRQAVEALIEPGVRVKFKQPPEFSAGWTHEGARRAIQAAQRSPGVDVVIALGHLVSAAALEQGPGLKKPVVLVFFFDPEHSLPQGTRAPANTLPVGAQGLIRGDMETLAGMSPDNRKTTILADEELLKAYPQLSSRLADTAQAAGVVADVQPLSRDSSATIGRLGDDTKLVYVLPGHRLDDDEQAQFYASLKDRGIWAFSGDGHAAVDAGALAGQWPDLQERMARHAALAAVAFLEGQAPAKGAGLFEVSPQLAVSSTTAAAVGYDLSWQTAESARIIASGAVTRQDHANIDLAATAGTPAGERLSWNDAVLRAVEYNESYQADRALLDKQRQDRNETITALLPQLSAGFGYFRVDDNEAIRSMYSMPVDMTYADASLRQTIFSDPAISRIRSANREFESAALELESTRLDVAEETEKIYLTCLSAAAQYAIAQYNLEITLENLALARRRVQVGAAGSQEVYRWTAKKAQSERYVLEARAGMQTAMVLLNQVLGQEDQGQVWDLEDRRPEDLPGVFSTTQFKALVDDQGRFAAFRDRMIAEALAAAPEIQALHSMIEATRIMQGQYKRRFFVPEASAGLEYWHRFEQEFLGNACMQKDQSGNTCLPPATRDHFMLSVSVTWPLLEGGKKVVDLKRNTAVIQRLRHLRAQSSLEVQSRMRDSLIQAVKARADIDLAREASEAADKDFKMSQDAYGQGVSSMVELLDAQHQMVVQRLARILTEYDYVRAIVDVQRAASRLPALMTREDVQQWMHKLQGNQG